MTGRRQILSLGTYLALVFAGLIFVVSVRAQEATLEPGPTVVELDGLIAGLDSAEFAERQDASQKLAEQGALALPALEKAAQGDSREAASRSLELIKKLFDSKDAATKLQAEAALKRLAESEKPSLAKSAQNILTPPQELPPPQINPGPRMQIAPIQIQVQAVNGHRKMSVREQNGVRDIEAVEENRKVKIHDDPNNGIQVEITETKDGKEETRKYEAKNAEELKKNSPDAYKAFEEFGQRNRAKIQIFGGQVVPGAALPGIQLPGIPVPGAVPGIPAGIPGVDPDMIRRRRVEGLDRALEGVQRAIDELERQKLRILEQRAQIEAQAPIPVEPPVQAPAEVPTPATK